MSYVRIIISRLPFANIAVNLALSQYSYDPTLCLSWIVSGMKVKRTEKCNFIFSFCHLLLFFLSGCLLFNSIVSS